jgi:hypothetical protein
MIDPSENCWSEAAFPSIDDFSTHQHSSAAALGIFNQLQKPKELRFGGDWPGIEVVLITRMLPTSGHTMSEFDNSPREIIRLITVNIDPFDGDTALSGIEERAPHRRMSRTFNVSILTDDHRVIAA